MALCAAAALRSRLSERGYNEPLRLEPRQRVVHTAQQYFAAGRSLDFLGYRNAIGFVANANDGQYDHQFEIAEDWCGCHLFKILE